MDKEFPGGAVDMSPPANAGDTGSILGPGGSRVLGNKHACPSQLRSLSLEPVLCDGRSHCREQPVRTLQPRSSSCSHGWRPPAKATQTQRSQSVKNKTNGQDSGRRFCLVSFQPIGTECQRGRCQAPCLKLRLMTKRHGPCLPGVFQNYLGKGSSFFFFFSSIFIFLFFFFKKKLVY